MRGVSILSSNAFVLVECLHRQFRTNKSKRLENPEWNKSTQFHFFEQPKKLSFIVFYHNETTETGTPIGYNTVNLDEYFKLDSQGFDGNIELLDSSLGAQLEIKLNCQHLQPRKILQQFATISALESDDQELNEKIIEQQMVIFRNDKDNMNKVMHESSDERQNKPLHLLDEHDVIDKIKHWVYNDINYEKNLIDTMHIFSRNSLSGKFISFASIDNAKQIVKDELMTFMEENTIDIMFDNFKVFKNSKSEKIRSLSSPEIGYIIYHFPLINLLEKIENDKINGTEFISRYRNKDKFIRNTTGWNKKEIYQIQAILFRNLSMTKREIIQNMDEIMNRKRTISEPIKQQIKSKISEFDVESLAFKIKTAKEIDGFSESIMNLVDDLIDKNEVYKKNHDINAYLSDDFVPKLYSLIANIFIYKDLNKDRLSWEQKQWECYNCSYHNYSKIVDKKQQTEISICLLCGISQTESITLKLRQFDTFTMVRSNDIKEDDLKSAEVERDKIDELIEKAMLNQSFDLSCPSRNDSHICPAIYRLAKILIRYKRWITTIYKNTNGQDNIDKTVIVNLKGNVDSEIYKEALIDATKSIKHKKFTEKMRQSILAMISNNISNISDIDTYLSMEKNKTFGLLLKKHCKIPPMWGCRIYTLTKKRLMIVAQGNQFGKFLDNLDMTQIDQFYHHILRIHIKEGNRTTIKNTFRLFGRVIHYDDNTKETNECRSIQRREQRVQRLGSTKTSTTESKEEIKMNQKENKEIWKLNQIYVQSQLDMIHAYLVHSDWKDRVNRYINNKDKKDNKERDEEEEYELEDVETTAIISDENRAKYVTNSYGFGVDHSHPHLCPMYPSLHDELLLNKLHPINERTFCNLLIKALKIHKIATTTYRDRLLCKYYRKEYNIIRNEPIGLGHVLALIIYTDVSDFCTVFRQTYRKMHKDETTKQVTLRHQQLYHFSRLLFEAVEFYGTHMQRSAKVYHGLSVVLHFGQFTAYFNQPISTTTDITTAHQFSQGKGIILTLKTGTNNRVNKNRVPKFLAVSWLSAFPHEDEKLFYGLYVRFQIDDIIEGRNLQSHSGELHAFNKFQQLLTNVKVDWDVGNKTGSVITSLAKLIKSHQNNQEASTDASRYGYNAFRYFCNHPDRSKITIKKFKTIPPLLYKALFGTKSYSQISFIPLAKTFPYLIELILTDLEMGHLLVNIEQYIKSIDSFIDKKRESKLNNINKITFKTEKQMDRKLSPVLQKYHEKLVGNNVNWKIEYVHSYQDDGCYHTITASKYDRLNDQQIMEFNKERIKIYSQEQIIQLIQKICDESEDGKLIDHKPEFLSFVKQKNINGESFIKFDRKGFGSSVVNHFDNKKLRGPAVKLYTNIFNHLSHKITINNPQKEKQSLPNNELKEAKMKEKDNTLHGNGHDASYSTIEAVIEAPHKPANKDPIEEKVYIEAERKVDDTTITRDKLYQLQLPNDNPFEYDNETLLNRALISILKE